MHTLFTKGLNGEAQKETEIGRVPKSWEVVRLGDEDVADIIMGQSPPSITYNKEGIGLPFFQGKAEFGENYPTPIKWCLKPIKIAKEKDILVSVRAPVGDVNIALFECCIGRGLAAIRPKDNLEPVYLLYYLKTSKGRLEEEGGGTTFKAVGKSVLQNFKIPLPPLPEQQQIAHILSTVDNKIDVEERRKATLKELFKTMLHKLMTGEIRLKDVEL
jgi:type I restriction enzyme S subunit